VSSSSWCLPVFLLVQFKANKLVYCLLKVFVKIRVEIRLWLLLWGVVVPSFVSLVVALSVNKDWFVIVFLVRFWVVTGVDIKTANSNKLRNSAQEASGISWGKKPRSEVERMIKERQWHAQVTTLTFSSLKVFDESILFVPVVEVSNFLVVVRFSWPLDEPPISDFLAFTGLNLFHNI
jgi:hypothetical protein